MNDKRKVHVSKFLSRHLRHAPADLGLTLGPGGWVPVDARNLSTRFRDVYALGDVAHTPVAKAGVFAENAAAIVADNIAARLHGRSLERRYEGAGSCFIEFGGGNVGKVEANFLGGPEPTARLVGPSPELAAEKEAFGSIRRERWFRASPPPGCGSRPGSSR